jgi:hypothetical protein
MLRTRFRTRARFIPALSGGGGLSITNSLRFNDDDSAYLSRTQISGDEKKFTVSFWVKRGNLVNSTLFAASNLSSFTDRDNESINFLNDKITWGAQKKVGGGAFIFAYSVETQALLRDVSGWYHVVVAKDLSQASASDRIKIYVNGVLQTLNILNAVGTEDTAMNRAGEPAYIGYLGTAAPNHYDGYMAEVNFIDGQQLTADSFGKVDAVTGEWTAKEYASTYGNNGYHLEFAGNANDSSGNGNNFTANNIAATDYMIDTPTNNFSTLNPDTTLITSEGNLKATTNVITTWQSVVSTMGVSSGKWYFETCAPQALNNPPYAFIGITTNPDFGGNIFLGGTVDSWGYLTNGDKYTNSINAVYGATYTLGDVIGCAIDMDAGTVEFFKNNVSQGVAYTGLTGTMFCGTSVYADSGTASNNINFGADSSFAGLKTRQNNTDENGKGDFYYEPAAGFLALCQDNLETLPFSASGGTETTITDGGVDYKVHTFTSSDTLYVQGIRQVEYLVVGGGGGGGAGSDNNQSGGGGGAGGYRSSVFGESSGGGASAEPKLAVTSGSYAVFVGGGASVGALYGGVSGNPSSFGVITSAGGGGGSDSRGDFPVTSGGSGGGGGSTGGTTGASGTSGQGFDGGSGSSSNGGGGGGAGEAGSTDALRYGGDGVASNITGSSIVRAGGGGGGAGIGGDGGGGNGGADGGNNQGLAGTINTGGGGGGGWRETSGDPRGGNGGSGIVIIRYVI